MLTTGESFHMYHVHTALFFKGQELNGQKGERFSFIVGAYDADAAVLQVKDSLWRQDSEKKGRRLLRIWVRGVHPWVNDICPKQCEHA